jgi:hypothetical protein
VIKCQTGSGHPPGEDSHLKIQELQTFVDQVAQICGFVRQKNTPPEISNPLWISCTPQMVFVSKIVLLDVGDMCFEVFDICIKWSGHIPPPHHHRGDSVPVLERGGCLEAWSIYIYNIYGRVRVDSRIMIL